MNKLNFDYQFDSPYNDLECDCESKYKRQAEIYKEQTIEWQQACKDKDEQILHLVKCINDSDEARLDLVKSINGTLDVISYWKKEYFELKSKFDYWDLYKEDQETFEKINKICTSHALKLLAETGIEL